MFYDFINRAGQVVVRATGDFEEEATRTFDAIGWERAHIRTLRHSVVAFEGGEVVAAKMYDDNGAAMAVPRENQYWSESRLDRLCQLARVETVIAGHPLAAAIREDIRQERQMLEPAEPKGTAHD